MKKFLLPEKGKFYKANLHSHTTRSDGNLSPEEMKEEYRKRGYSILATSDHDVLYCNYNLSDKDFLIITAYEISIRSDDSGIPYALRKIVDLNLFAKEPYNVTHIGFHPETVEHWIRKERITAEQAKNIKYAGELRDMHYYPANINKIIRSANENGFLVSINHPMWSLTNFADYGSYEGAWAVEVYNHGCSVLSGLGDSEQVFDEILRSGKQIFAIATDDNHNSFPLDSNRCDSFGGFTMIKSENLDYSSVIAAMERGDFYASTGPEIYELYYEDGKVCIKCSEAAEICMTSMSRMGMRASNEDGSPITEAVFNIEKGLFGAKIDKSVYGYIKFRVTDMRGKKAYTNAYYIEDIEKSVKTVKAIL